LTNSNKTRFFPILFLNFWHANHATSFHSFSVAHSDQGLMKREVDGVSKSGACAAFAFDRADALYWRKRDDLLKNLESFHVQSRAMVNDAINEAFKESRLLNLQLHEEREKVQFLYRT